MIEKTENNKDDPQTAEKQSTPAPEQQELAKGFAGIPPDRRSASLFHEGVFKIDETAFFSSMPKVSHWSIAWSDLMMTMFILFLSMFVYQAAHKDFLISNESEVIGGDTIEAVEIANENEASFPFVPIKPGKPLISEESVRKVEQINLQDIDVDTPFFEEDTKGGLDKIRESFRRPKEEPQTDSGSANQLSPEIGEPTIAVDEVIPDNPLPAREEAVTGEEFIQEETVPDDILPAREEAILEPSEGEGVDTIFSMNKEDIARLGLKDFASIDLVPDKTMRIILTGDLFFDTGRAELNEASRSSLQKIAEVLQNTPYMINIIGHTDNIPMSSERYATNWELSVARASTVARFLIEQMGMNPNQFVVSGFASYRPLKPNTNARNRAANRRVEIIISKRLPAPVSASADTIN